MSNAVDRHDINDIAVGVSREMRVRPGDRHAGANTLFMGGGRPDEADLRRLANFGLRKNYNIIYAAVERGDQRPHSLHFHAVVTDGSTRAVALQDGRLWKRDRKSVAVLIFPDTETLIKFNGRDQMIVREMRGQYHDQGHELALESVSRRAARKPGHVPVISPIGNLTTILDLRTLTDMFAAAD